MTVAVLFAYADGCYAGVPGVELWDIKRDARNYAGPWPVVAHPPCSRWCRLAAVNEKRWGAMRGDDGGCFGSALNSVRAWGGVLEHPAYTDAWQAFGLARPHGSGWQATIDGGWVCHVEQAHYGHRAKKATWLYAYGVDSPPRLVWGSSGRAEALVSACANHTDPNDDRPRIMKREAATTPPKFRDMLLSIARSVRREAA